MGSLIPLWAAVTLAAACLQVCRTGIQKSLAAEMDNLSGVWVRYIYALPLVPVLLLLFFAESGLPPLPLRFLGCCLAAGVCQIIATFLLLSLFGQRSFAVSTVFAKTEGLQIALLGLAVFAEPFSLVGLAGIAAGGAGVCLLLPWRRQAATRRVMATGLGSGFFFALTSWFIRFSYGEVEAAPLPAAALTLSAMVLMQSALLGGVLAARRGGFAAVFGRRVRRRALGVGASSLAGSLCWFWAFALANPAYVKTLAQVELPLALLLGRVAFAERATAREVAGIAAIGVGAVAVLFA